MINVFATGHSYTQKDLKVHSNKLAKERTNGKPQSFATEVEQILT